MMMVPRETPPVIRPENQTGPSRIDLLKEKIRSEAYLAEAIQRMANVMSNEILGIPQGGMIHEQQRKRRK
jgi:hypothetical protein